jgi:hypothetical protein
MSELYFPTLGVYRDMEALVYSKVSHTDLDSIVAPCQKFEYLLDVANHLGVSILGVQWHCFNGIF